MISNCPAIFHVLGLNVKGLESRLLEAHSPFNAADSPEAHKGR